MCVHMVCAYGVCIWCVYMCVCMCVSVSHIALTSEVFAMEDIFEQHSQQRHSIDNIATESATG